MGPYKPLLLGYMEITGVDRPDRTYDDEEHPTFVPLYERQWKSPTLSTSLNQPFQINESPYNEQPPC